MRQALPTVSPGLLAFLACAVALRASAYEGSSRPESVPEPEHTPVMTRAPELLEAHEPVYPSELVEREARGDVLLLIDIDVDGTVSRAEVVQSSGERLFDRAAVRALVLYRFSPAEFDGVPTLVRVEYRQHFVPDLVEEERKPDDETPAPVNLHGRVLERGTRDPIEGASVYVPDAELVARTDAQGRFELAGVPAGRTRVEIRHPRYRPFDATEDIVEGEATELTVYVWKEVEGGFEVTVRAERPKKEVARRTLEQAELKSVPGTFGDPVRVVQNLPGVARPAYAGGQLLVRGAAPEDTGVYVDGVPIPILFHFAGGPSVLNPNFIDSIDFYPGAYGSRYGRAIAGILDVVSKRPRATAFHGEFDIDFLDAGFYLEGPAGDDGAWAVAARRSYVDAFLPFVLDAVRPEGGANFVAAPAYWDYQARFDTRVGKNRLEFFAFGSNDSLVGALAGDAETQGFALGSRQGFHRLRLGWSRLLGSGWTLRAAPTFGWSTQSFELGSGDLELGGELDWWSVNFRASASRDFSERLSLELGAEANELFYDVRLKVPEPPPFFPFPGQNVDLPIVERTMALRGAAYALYAEAVWNPVAPLKLIPGARVELYRTPERLLPSLEPRLAVRWEILPVTTLKAAWGIYRQNPQPQDLDPQFGNPWLELLRSHQWVAGVEQRLTEALSVDVQGFLNRRSNLRRGGRRIVDVDGEERLVTGANDGHGRAYGLEVLVKHALTERMYGWLSYTLSRSEIWNDRREAFVPVGFDQTHILTAVASYKWNYGIETGARFRLTTGRPDSDVIDATYDADTNGYRAISTPPGSVRGATFHQLDVRVEKLWTFEKWRLSAYLDIQNLYNAENPEFTVWDYRYEQSASVRGLPFLPTLGVTGAF